MNFLWRLTSQEKKNMMTARVSMLLKSRASLICFRACFLPGRAKDYQHPGITGLVLYRYTSHALSNLQHKITPITKNPFLFIELQNRPAYRTTQTDMSSFTIVISLSLKESLHSESNLGIIQDGRFVQQIITDNVRKIFDL